MLLNAVALFFALNFVNFGLDLVLHDALFHILGYLFCNPLLQKVHSLLCFFVLVFRFSRIRLEVRNSCKKWTAGWLGRSGRFVAAQGRHR